MCLDRSDKSMTYAALPTKTNEKMGFRRWVTASAVSGTSSARLVPPLSPELHAASLTSSPP
jgi:hypothetical protein